MKITTFLIGVFVFLFAASRTSAFEWPGGPMTITVTCTGSEVFAGWVPSSPWGSTAFLTDPRLRLRDGSGSYVGDQVITGGVMDWYDSATRTATVMFNVPAGTYTLVGVDGLRHIRISGEGWSGFRLAFTSIVEPVTAPVNNAPAVTWTSSPGNAPHAQGYIVMARGHDDDGNLAQVNVWKNGVPFAFAGGGDGTDGDSGNWTSDAGPQTVTFTAQAVDTDGATSAVISMTVAIDAPPPPAQYTLTTVAGAGGSVSAGGTFMAGTVVYISATADATHHFAGWTGDAGGMANPEAVTLDRDKVVQANFALKVFALTTSASGSGSVTPGGSYPYGTTVTLVANPDAVSRFIGWTGDVTGPAASIAVTMTGTKAVQAVFVPKDAQSINFTNPGNRAAGAPPFPLDATTSSGLPVLFTVVSGPATISGGHLTITGPGTITLQASQAGDAYYLPAPAVTQTINSVAPAILKYRGAARTVLQSRITGSPTNLVLENP